MPFPLLQKFLENVVKALISILRSLAALFYVHIYVITVIERYVCHEPQILEFGLAILTDLQVACLAEIACLLMITYHAKMALSITLPHWMIIKAFRSPCFLLCQKKCH